MNLRTYIIPALFIIMSYPMASYANIRANDYLGDAHALLNAHVTTEHIIDLLGEEGTGFRDRLLEAIPPGTISIQENQWNVNWDHVRRALQTPTTSSRDFHTECERIMRMAMAIRRTSFTLTEREARNICAGRDLAERIRTCNLIVDSRLTLSARVDRAEEECQIRLNNIENLQPITTCIGYLQTATIPVMFSSSGTHNASHALTRTLIPSRYHNDICNSENRYRECRNALNRTLVSRGLYMVNVNAPAMCNRLIPSAPTLN